MRNLHLLILGIVALGVSPRIFAEGLLKWPGEWTPFVERISPDDFLVVANNVDVSLTDTADLSIIQYSAQEFGWDSYSVRRIPGEGYQLTSSNSDKIHQRTVMLPKEIGNRLMNVMEFALTTKVLAPSGRASASLGNTWVFLRIDQQRAIAGSVWAPYRCAMGFESTMPFLDLLYRLSQCLEKDARTIEGSPLTMLDLAISNLRLSYPAKH